MRPVQPTVSGGGQYTKLERTTKYLFLLSYIYSFIIIDDIIGADAGKSHGYSAILALMLYPVLLPIYGLFMWLIDKIIKRKISK